ncbi:MAG: hypothetical protein WDN02_12070 [Methylovirgula sp.]|uniref:hypothetical protein n=1 Tax=Methylovirgula sp. TaxID=1978224 RepID=UPI003076878E
MWTFLETWRRSPRNRTARSRKPSNPQISLCLRFIKSACSNSARIHDDAFTMMLSPAQCRGARGLLDWSRRQLALAANIDIANILELEADEGHVPAAVGDALRGAFESGGIIFIPEDSEGAGVRLRKPRENSAELTRRIDTIEDNLAKTEGPSAQTPEGGMRTLERAHKRNAVTKLKNRRTKLKEKAK